MKNTTKNPYIKLINIMRNQGAKDNPGSWGLGKVVSANPLRVEYMGIVLEADQLVRMSRGTYKEGDELAIMPNQGYDKFIVMGKREVDEEGGEAL